MARSDPSPAKANRGNRSPRTALQLAILDRGRRLGPEDAKRRAAEARARALRYREEQPFRALLDSIYGVPTIAAPGRFPFHDHRTCAAWLEAE